MGATAGENEESLLFSPLRRDTPNTTVFGPKLFSLILGKVDYKRKRVFSCHAQEWPTPSERSSGFAGQSSRGWTVEAHGDAKGQRITFSKGPNGKGNKDVNILHALCPVAGCKFCLRLRHANEN